jgi:hypothetical protein
MKNKCLLGLLTVILLCGLGYGGFQIKRRCDLTEYYKESLYNGFFLFYESGYYPSEYMGSLDTHMARDGYSQAEISKMYSKAQTRAYDEHENPFQS